MPSRCSDCPGGATHFGSGWAANSAACSALRAKRAVDDQPDAVFAPPRPPSGRTPARRRDASACPAGARAAPCTRRRRPPRCPTRRRRDELGLRGRVAGDVVRPCPSEIPSRTTTRRRGGASPSPGNVTSTSAAPLRLRSGHREAPTEREVLRPLEVRRVRASADLGRREHARVGVPHRARPGERGEVRGALVLAADADRAGDAAEDDRAEQHRHERADDQEARLALLGVSAGVGHAGQPGEEGVTGLRPVCTDFATNV